MEDKERGQKRVSGRNEGRVGKRRRKGGDGGREE